MTALPASPQPQLASVELQATNSRLSPLPSPRPGNGFPASPRFAGGPNKPEGEGLDQWFEDLSKFEVTLEAMAEASQDPKFSEELGTIEQWFGVLGEAERTAALYTLLQHSNQVQIRFFITILQQMQTAPPTGALEGSFKAKQAQASRSLRPPNLNIAPPGTPKTPSSLSALQSALSPSQEVVAESSSWANMVSTPAVPMFNKPASKPAAESPLPPMMTPAMYPGMMNPLMLGQMGLTNEAQLSQLLAMQMMMSGMVQPGVQMAPAPGQKSGASSKGANWRTPSSGTARYPGSALRSAGSKSSAGAKSSGLKSASSVGSGTTPREDDVDPELLKDVPAWLRSLRLHKYTASFEGMTWENMVELDDAMLEKKGVAALGARRRLLKTFDLVRRKMGMEPLPGSEALNAPASALPKVTLPEDGNSSPPSAAALAPPKSAAP
ncbi:SAM domain-containing protein [Mycena kentingensis (nom. inval.)]|nr:SAM domain-containing protein [Mycena kentingensis (nom. inval.)]